MSTEVKLYGLVSGGMLQFFPRISDYEPEMGLRGLGETLEYVTRDRSDLLEEYTDDPRDGLRQYMVLNTEGLLDHIETHPYIWDSLGYGFKAGVRLMREKPELRWWFHVCF